MASGKSGYYMSENYIGTRRGRDASGDIGFEMFPEKYEVTDMEEDPHQLDENWRETLMDRNPDDPTFAHEEVRRNTYSRDFLNLRSGGSRVNTDPWQNEGFDTQFHDKDPRGWSGEHDWKEYRRVQEKMMSQIDFKDDGDYSVPSAGVHPNTMYKNIKAAFHWTKSRMKWFDTAKDNFHNGGVGKYKWQHASNVGLTDVEDTSSMVDPRYMEAAGRSHRTTNLSNIVNTGSKFLRANTTTDQEVKVAAYGKLRRYRGLMNHESQLREVADDRPMSKVSDMSQTPANVVALMSTAVDGLTASASGRQMRQNAVGDKEKFASVSEQELANRNRRITTEIMSLLGFTDNEIKWLDSYAGKNKKHADLMQANLFKLTEMVHKTPAHIKLAMRDELLSGSLSRGLCPATPSQMRHARDRVILNPKIVQYMDLMVRKTEKPGDENTNRRYGVGDSEGKLANEFAKGKLFIQKSAEVGGTDIDANRRSTSGQRAQARGKRESKTKSYAALSRRAEKINKNRQAGGDNTQELFDSVRRITGQNMPIGQTRNADVNTTANDANFDDNRYQDRSGGGNMGTKYLNREMDVEDRVLGMHEVDMQVRGRGNSVAVNG
jgi:hypothetical protein